MSSFLHFFFFILLLFNNPLSQADEETGREGSEGSHESGAVSSQVEIKECHIENHPYMVSFTKTTGRTGARSFRSHNGVLLTLRWVITTRRVLRSAEDLKMSLVIAGGDQAFYADYVQHYRVATNLYSFKHQHAEDKDLGSVAVAFLDRPFVESAMIQAVKLPPNKDFTDKCKKVTLVRFAMEQTESYRLTCYENVAITKHECHTVTETNLYTKRRKGSNTESELITNDEIVEYPVFCTARGDFIPFLCGNDEGTAALCDGKLIGLSAVPETYTGHCSFHEFSTKPEPPDKPHGLYLAAIANGTTQTSNGTVVRKRRGTPEVPQLNYHVKVGDFMTYLKRTTKITAPYESAPTGLDAAGVLDGTSGATGTFDGFFILTIFLSQILVAKLVCTFWR